MNQVPELAPFSVALGSNYIKHNHRGPNCHLMAVATHNGWVTDSREMESEGERSAEEERQDAAFFLPGTQSGFGGRLDGTVSVSLRGRVFRSSFSPDGRDTHILALVRRPPTPDTGRVPGLDVVKATSSSRDRSVPSCHMSVTISHNHVSLPPPPPPPPPPAASLII